MAESYVEGDQATKNALQAIGLPEVDPNGPKVDWPRKSSRTTEAGKVAELSAVTC